MIRSQHQFFSDINKLQEKVARLQEQYWLTYTNINSWQFWIMVLMLIIPLAILLQRIDKSKLFLMLFYAFNIHAWFAYIDSIGVRRGYWEYPHSLTPYFPFSLALDGSLVPVSFMFVYQWTLNKKKNYYIYTVALSMFFSFVFKPLLVGIGLFEMHKGFNYLYLFLLYCLLFLLAKGFTSFFLWFQQKYSNDSRLK